jgi:hypothetical protein
MNRKLQRTTNAAIKGVNYIDAELEHVGTEIL